MKRIRFYSVIGIISIILISHVFIGCDGTGGGNWFSFRSTGQYAGSIYSYRHTFINEATIGVTVQFRNTSMHIPSRSSASAVVSDGTGDMSMSAFSLSCSVRADDDRDLKITQGSYRVVFYDK